MKHLLVLLLINCLMFGQAEAQLSVPSRQPDLFSIIRSGDNNALKLALDAGTNANDSVERYSLLMLAAMSGTIDQMKLLVDRGASVNYMNRDSLTALWLAIPDYEKTIFLLRKGADPRVKTVGGRTPIVKLALMPGSADLIQEFVRRGVDLLANNQNNVLIENAALSADTANLGIFIRHGLDVNAPDARATSPVAYIANFNCFPTLKMLVDNGANVNAADPRTKLTPLMNTTYCGDDSATLYLLQKGADPKMIDIYSGYTALMWLSQSEIDQPELVEALCKKMGPVVFHKGKDGLDANYWMRTKGSTKSVQVLASYQQNKN